MITEDYVSFEVAKLLKEKGFNEPIWTCYKDDNEVIFGDKYDWNNSPMGQTSAPTLQMAMKWLREIHNIHIEIFVIKNFDKKTCKYTYTIMDLNFPGSDDGIDCCNEYKTYEEATEAALKYYLEKMI